MLLLKNCAQVVFSQNGKPRIGKDLAKIETKENVDVLIENGRFTKIGSVWVLRLSHEVQLFLIILYFYGNVFGIHCQQGVGTLSLDFQATSKLTGFNLSQRC